MYNDLNGTIVSMVVILIFAVIIVSFGFFLWKKLRMYLTGGYVILYGIIIPFLWISLMTNMYQYGNSTGAGGFVEIFSSIGGVIFFIPVALLESVIKFIINKKTRYKEPMILYHKLKFHFQNGIFLSISIIMYTLYVFVEGLF